LPPEKLGVVITGGTGAQWLVADRSRARLLT